MKLWNQSLNNDVAHTHDSFSKTRAGSDPRDNLIVLVFIISTCLHIILYLSKAKCVYRCVV